jgi:zinc transporter
MGDMDGLVVGYYLDGKGGGQQIGWEEVLQWSADKGGLLWVHLDRESERVQHYLHEQSGLNPILVDALLEVETRPRSFMTESGLFVILRGVNLNPGANPEDMVAIRLWIDSKRIISVRRRRLISIDALRHSIESGTGPATAGEFLVSLAEGLVERMATVVEEIDDSMDELEDAVITTESYQLRSRIANLRREIITLRRYLAPQRDAIARLQNESVTWLQAADRMRLREITDRTMRYVEDLDSARERASVTQEELMGRLSEQMNKRMYLLSLVAVIFLPLGFITGLLGVNVGGIPGANYHWAFLILIIALITIIVFQIYIFKKKKWM